MIPAGVFDASKGRLTRRSMESRLTWTVKYAVISDIHANLKALQQVLEDSQAQGCTHTVCLGDIVERIHSRIRASAGVPNNSRTLLMAKPFFLRHSRFRATA